MIGANDCLMNFWIEHNRDYFMFPRAVDEFTVNFPFLYYSYNNASTFQMRIETQVHLQQMKFYLLKIKLCYHSNLESRDMHN